MDPFKKIPSHFQIKHTGGCGYCNCGNITETINYRLVIKTNSSYDKNNIETRSYYVFYSPEFYRSFSKNPETIGISLGVGKPLNDAINEMKEILIEKEILPLNK